MSRPVLRRPRPLALFLCFFVFQIAFAATAAAQAVYGSVRGTITDASGARAARASA